MKIKTLPDIIRKNGFKYTRIGSTVVGSLWEQASGNRVVAYEVGYMKTTPPRIHFKEDMSFDLVERFWGNEDFGRLAWCVKNLEDAKRRLQELENDQT